MSFLNRGPGPFPHLAHDAEKYRALAEDLRRIARGGHPCPDVLLNAPCLSGWRVRVGPIPQLEGIVVGHPEIADGRVCRTSLLVTYDPEIGYARTFSRFYRLGHRLEIGSDEGTGVPTG